MKPRRLPDVDPVSNFEEQVMLAVVRTGDHAYGMNVRRELEDVTGREVTIGSVYTTLDRLEAKALVASTRVAGTGASSLRVFAVTVDGLRALAETRAQRDRLWNGINLQALLRGT